MKINKDLEQLCKLTFTDNVIQWLVDNFFFISANDFDGYMIDAHTIYPKDYKQGLIRVFYDIEGNINVICNPDKYRKPQKKAKKFINKLIRDGLLTLYDDPSEPFEEFSLKHNIPIIIDNVRFLESNLLTKSKIWEENINNGKETC